MKTLVEELKEYDDYLVRSHLSHRAAERCIAIAEEHEQRLPPARGADYFGISGTRGLDAAHPTEI